VPAGAAGDDAAAGDGGAAPAWMGWSPAGGTIALAGTSCPAGIASATVMARLGAGTATAPAGALAVSRAAARCCWRGAGATRV
jgi:hypothetical protein